MSKNPACQSQTAAVWTHCLIVWLVEVFCFQLKDIVSSIINLILGALWGKLTHQTEF